MHPPRTPGLHFCGPNIADERNEPGRRQLQPSADGLAWKRSTRSSLSTIAPNTRNVAIACRELNERYPHGLVMYAVQLVGTSYGQLLVKQPQSQRPVLARKSKQ